MFNSALVTPLIKKPDQEQQKHFKLWTLLRWKDSWSYKYLFFSCRPGVYCCPTHLRSIS